MMQPVSGQYLLISVSQHCYFLPLIFDKQQVGVEVKVVESVRAHLQEFLEDDNGHADLALVMIRDSHLRHDVETLLETGAL